MRALIYYVASTLDGFIAREDGSLDGFTWDDEYLADLRETFPETFPAHFYEPGQVVENKVFDTVLMGRKTYENGLKEGITNPYPTLRQYVFSRTMAESPDKHVQLVSENAVELVRDLKRESGEAIWLCGGGQLASLLLAAELIDKMTVKLNPVLFGSGIPLFSGSGAWSALELTDSKAYESGHVRLHYLVR